MLGLLIFVSLFTLALWSVLLLHRQWLYVRRFKDFPQVQGNFLFGNFGTLLTYRDSFHSLIKEFIGKISLEGWIVAWVFWYPVVFCYRPEINHKILHKKPIGRGWLSRFMFDYIDGLVISGSAKWQRRRTMIAPSFSPKVIQSFFPTIVDKSKDLVESLKTCGGPIQFFPVALNLSLNIFMETSLALEESSFAHLKPVICHSLHEMVNWMIKTTYNPFLWTETTGKIYKFVTQKDSGRKVLEKCCMDIIKSKVQARLADSDEPQIDCLMDHKNKIFLDHLLDAFLTDKSAKIDFEGIMEELMTFYLASTETVSSAATWTLHNLGNHPDIQEELYRELAAHFPDGDRNITIEELEELKLLDQVCKESLRLRPSIPWIPRLLGEDVDINGKVIPKNTLAVISVHYAHRDSTIFPSPGTFDPSRFSPENAAKIPPGAYIPFGDGPRKCIGYRTGMTSLKIIIGHIIKNFKVVSSEPFNVKYDLLVVTRPKKHLELNFIPRNNN